MKHLCLASLACVIVAVGCGGNSGPPIDQKGKLLFRFQGKQSVVDVEYGLQKEMTDPAFAGRKDPDGTKHALVKKARLVTKKFSADGQDVTVDLGFDWGKESGKITLGDKTCPVFRLSWGSGTVDDVHYEGFTGTCSLDRSDQEFIVGLVKS